MNYLRTPLLFLVMVGSLSAQEPKITPETPVSNVILDQWLHSGDPRLIAWAATFAQQTHDAKIVAEMPSLLDHWPVPEIFGDEKSQASQKRAVGAVLDALIQENVHVSASTINSIAESYPAAASVLISRLPLSESRQTLDDWIYGATGAWGGRTLARVASMMLAKDPGTSRAVWNGDLVGFVASVVGASEAELHIKIKATNAIGEGTGMGACGDSMGRELTPGWPQVYSYFLSENDPQAATHIVIDLDGDSIAFTRIKENGGWGSCYGVKWLDSSTRHRLIAHWLGVEDNQVPWHPAETFTIVWTNKKDYEQQVGQITELQREKLQTTVQTLQKRGFLTEGEAATVLPKLVITIKCEIKPCPLV